MVCRISAQNQLFAHYDWLILDAHKVSPIKKLQETELKSWKPFVNGTC